MEKVIAGLERLEKAINDKTDPLVLNAESATQYADVQSRIKNIFSSATDPDKKVLGVLEDSMKQSESIMRDFGDLKGDDYIAKSGLSEEASQVFQKAKADFVNVQNKQAAFCRGETIEGFEHTASDGLKKAYTEAEHAAHKLIGKASGRLGIARTAENGWSKAFKKNVNEMNGFKVGLEPMQRAKAFGRVGLVTAGTAAIIDAGFRSKDSEGESRGVLTRIVEGGVGSIVVGASLVGGRAIAR